MHWHTANRLYEMLLPGLVALIVEYRSVGGVFPRVTRHYTAIHTFVPGEGKGDGE